MPNWLVRRAKSRWALSAVPANQQCLWREQVLFEKSPVPDSNVSDETSGNPYMATW